MTRNNKRGQRPLFGCVVAVMNNSCELYLLSHNARHGVHYGKVGRRYFKNSMNVKISGIEN